MNRCARALARRWVVLMAIVATTARALAACTDSDFDGDPEDRGAAAVAAAAVEASTEAQEQADAEAQSESDDDLADQQADEQAEPEEQEQAVPDTQAEADARDEAEEQATAEEQADDPGEEEQALPPDPDPDEGEPTEEPVVESEEDDDATVVADLPDAARGRELFFANGCSVCHGDTAEGGFGPTIAQTLFSLDRVIAQYRNPRALMPPFPADRVPDADVAHIYAWLQTLPLPDEVVPGLGTR